MFTYQKNGQLEPVATPVVNIALNGQPVKDWLSFTVTLSGLGDIDTYEVVLPWTIGDKPYDPLLYSGSAQSADLVNGTATIKIEAGYDGGEIKLLIEGDMDAPKWSFDNGERVTISGRSYASRAYDEKETVKYQNMTATEAHAKIAALHGLTPVAPVATTSMIGEYINDDHASLTSETSHWDLILYLAENEGFVTRVRGKEWYFGPLDSMPNFLLESLPYTFGVDIMRGLTFERAPNAARNLTVEIISYQPAKTKRGKGSRIIEKSSSVGKGINKYVVREYVPNITRDQAQRLAKNKLAELSKQQVFGSFSCNFNPELDIDRKVVLYGVGVGLSQHYFVQNIRISGDRQKGLKSEVSFSNLQLTEAGGYR